MAVILFGGEKGGTGKSTCTTNVALMSVYMNHDVIVVDATTKQSSTYKFFNRRKELGILPTPPCIRIQGKHLHAELEDLSKRAERVIVDVGGYDSPELRGAMAARCVNDMFSPFKASEFDLETAESIDELVYHAKSFNPNLTCHTIFNQISSTGGSEEVNAAREVLLSYENLKLSQTLIYTRKSISMAPKYALCVIEYEEELRSKLPPYRIKPYLYKSSIEFCQLYKTIFNEEFDSPKFATLKNYLLSKAETEEFSNE